MAETTVDSAAVQHVATRMIPERVRWALLLVVFVLQSVTAAALAAFAAVGWTAPAWVSFAGAFLLAISAPVTLLAAVNVTKTSSESEAGA